MFWLADMQLILTRCLSCFKEPVFENVDLGTTIARVRATDADSGLFAVIEYSLVDGEGKFGIKPSTVRSFASCNSAFSLLFSKLQSNFFKLESCYLLLLVLVMYTLCCKSCYLNNLLTAYRKARQFLFYNLTQKISMHWRLRGGLLCLLFSGCWKWSGLEMEAHTVPMHSLHF